MPKVKFQINCGEKYCGDCGFIDNPMIRDCGLFNILLNRDTVGYLRTPECLESEVKEEVCKWAIEYSTVKLSEVSTSCGITATWHNGIKFDFCPYCGKKVV